MTSDFSIIYHQFADAGQQLTNIAAAEASGGNLSVFTKSLETIPEFFTITRPITLPVSVPHLANGWLIITTSGSRLRDISNSAQTTLCLVNIHENGMSGTLFTAIPAGPSSEWNTHLAVHEDQVFRNNFHFHAVIHAQPIHLTYLSHINDYSEIQFLNRRLLRWQPETILTFPEGLGTLPFMLPGSNQLMEATVLGLRNYKAILWQRHGIVTRSNQGVIKAADLVEYVETAAHYEVTNLKCGNLSSGLSVDELRKICLDHDIYSPYINL